VGETDSTSKGFPGVSSAWWSAARRCMAPAFSAPSPGQTPHGSEGPFARGPDHDCSAGERTRTSKGFPGGGVRGGPKWRQGAWLLRFGTVEGSDAAWLRGAVPGRLGKDWASSRRSGRSPSPRRPGASWPLHPGRDRTRCAPASLICTRDPEGHGWKFPYGSAKVTHEEGGRVLFWCLA
jgi:hypothetical protein